MPFTIKKSSILNAAPKFEQCQKGLQVSSVRVEVGQNYIQKVKEDVKVKELIESNSIPKALCAAEALSFTSDEVDFRPHLYDKQTGQFQLVDSGSQVSAWPPDPGDRVDPSVHLKAVNNTKMKCYGFKEVEIKIVLLIDADFSLPTVLVSH